MTPIEIIETIIIWLFLANFICRKRKWYDTNRTLDERSIYVFAAFAFMPIVLLIALVREFVAREWTFYKE